MTRQKSMATFVALAIAGVVPGPAAAVGAQTVEAQVVEAEGVDLLRLTASPGQLTHVRVRVKVPEGSSAEDASRQALWARGAVPLRELGTDHSRRGDLPRRSGPPVARFDPADSTFTATPWPSDRFADFSESFPNPGSNAFLGPYLSYTDRAIDGFSRNGAVFFGLTASIDAATLPSAADAIHDPRAGAQLVDLTGPSAEYGRRIPVEFRQRDGAHDPYFPGDTLVMRPVNGFPLADDHTYCGLVTRRLKDRSGLPLQRDAAFGRALAEEASLAPLRSWLHGQPLAGEVVVATCFRTQDATGELHRIEQFLSHHPTSELYGVGTGRSNPAFHEILALYRAPNFQSGTAPYVTTDDDVVFGPDGQPVVQRQEELRVRLVVPRNRAMPAKGRPVVLYSHGTGGDWAHREYPSHARLRQAGPPHTRRSDQGTGRSPVVAGGAGRAGGPTGASVAVYLP